MAWPGLGIQVGGGTCQRPGRQGNRFDQHRLPCASIKIKVLRQSSQAESRPELGGAPCGAVLPGSHSAGREDNQSSEGNQGALTSSRGAVESNLTAAHSAVSWFGTWISKLYPAPLACSWKHFVGARLGTPPGGPYCLPSLSHHGSLTV